MNFVNEAVVSESTQRYVHHILEKAIQARASDIHLEPLSQSLRIRFRIDGQMQNIQSLSASTSPSILAYLKLLSKLNVAQCRLPQDGRFTLPLQEKVFDIRVATIPTVHGESIVLRILDKTKFLFSFSQLGFLDDHVKLLKNFIQKPDGMILFTGPTGSGKTTTLYSILHTLACPSKKIITLEDPVEYQLPNVHQVAVSPAIGLSFSAGLKSILRQSPDIIMVGEMRDLETTQIAIHAAITGHKVFSTLHTDNTIGALFRLLEMGIPYYLISAALRGIVAQRLVRKICPFCVQDATFTLSPEYKELLEDVPILSKIGIGCQKCLHTGFLGRLGIFEILDLVPDILNHITPTLSRSTLEAVLKSKNIRLLAQDAIFKAQRGLSTWEEISSILG